MPPYSFRLTWRRPSGAMCSSGWTRDPLVILDLITCLSTRVTITRLQWSPTPT